MKKVETKNANTVQPDGRSQKAEKLWYVQLGQVRRHSRVLYLPLDPQIVRLNKIKKGDLVKYELLEIIRAAEEDTPLTAEGEL